MRSLRPHSQPIGWRALAVAGGLACGPKHLSPQPVPAFPDAARAATNLPSNRRLMASGGSTALQASQTEQGVALAMAWRGTDGAKRWRYLLFSATGDGAWSWESPPGEAYGALHLGSGEAVDLLVEDTGSGAGPTRWVAIDRVARRPIASGSLDGPSCGDVINLGGDRFAFGSGDALMYWQPDMAAPTSLRAEPGPVCLRGALGEGEQRELFWVHGGETPALRQAVITLGAGRSLGGLADLTWPDAAQPVLAGQRFRVVKSASGGFDLVYPAIPRAGEPALVGLKLASYGADGALLGAPIPLTDPVDCGEGTDRWDALSTPGGPVVIRCAEGGPLSPSSPDLPLRTLPKAPGWMELALRYESDAALLCGPQGCDLWTELPDRGGLVRARLGPVGPADPTRDAANRDAVARAVDGLLHSDNEPESVLDLARKVCVPAEALEKRMGAGAEGPPAPRFDTRIWELPEGVITARFSPATGCLGEVEVLRYPPKRR